MGKSRNSNDNRSNSKNPNSPAYKAAMDNRANQLNPNNPGYRRGSSHIESDIIYPNQYINKVRRGNRVNRKNPSKKKSYKLANKPARNKYSKKYNPLKFKVKVKTRKTMMSQKASRRIQSHSDKTGENQKFKARAQRATDRRNVRK